MQYINYMKSILGVILTQFKLWPVIHRDFLSRESQCSGEAQGMANRNHLRLMRAKGLRASGQFIKDAISGTSRFEGILFQFLDVK